MKKTETASPKKRCIILFAIVLLCAILLFPACQTKISHDHILTDLYRNEELTRNDLMNIAALAVGYVAIVDNEEQKEEEYRRIDFTPVRPEPLTEEQEQRIEQAFKEEHVAMSETVTEYSLVGYYGKYGNYHIAMIHYELEESVFIAAVKKLIIDNIYFGYIDAGGGPNTFYVWNES